jgi:ABC-type nitrate/sulfonate/bicarbonate transport system substrate-binding protein
MTVETDASADYRKLWYTRCPVPAASGVAFQLGWLSAAFADEGIEIEALQDAPPDLIRHHFDHDLVGLFREGGNVPAIAARAAGAPTRLIGLTWIEEGQSIVVRPEPGIRTAADLRGKRVGIPAWAATPAESFPRAMALHGFQQALQLGGLTLDDVEIVELEWTPPALLTGPRDGGDRLPRRVFGIDAVESGAVDAIYGKGAAFAERVRETGLHVAVDLDALPDLRQRVNNGTPRPITVHERLLDERPDLVVGFLAASLRASDWAGDNPEGVGEILQRETFSGPAGIAAAHGNDFHLHLRADLSEQRLGLFAIQKQFLYAHGFLPRDFDLDRWVAPGPIREAQALVAGGQLVGEGSSR